jgi:hypothetical protein
LLKPSDVCLLVGRGLGVDGADVAVPLALDSGIESRGFDAWMTEGVVGALIRDS